LRSTLASDGDAAVCDRLRSTLASDGDAAVCDRLRSTLASDGDAAVCDRLRSTLASDGDAAVCDRLRSTLASDGDAAVCDRLRSTLASDGDSAWDGVTVICDDAISWLESAAAANAVPDDALIYCDPPYLLETRRSQRRIYAHEMTDALEHRHLLRCLRSLTCRVILSGYYSELYATELHDWRTLTYQAQTRGGSPATEYLWMNYTEPFELHDYKFLGSNFRERERIKRQQVRWQARLERMDPAQRYAMLEVIDRLRYPIAISSDTAPSPNPPILSGSYRHN